MASVKARHNIMMSPEAWTVLQELRRVQGESVSNLIEAAVWAYIKLNKYNATYFKIMSTAPPLDDADNAELTELLDSLTPEDLEVVESYELPRSDHDEGAPVP